MRQPDLALPVRGRAYSLPMRIGASLLMLGVAGYAARSWRELAALPLEAPIALVLLATLAGMLGSYAFLLRSVTVIDEHGVRQTGLMDKRVTWDQIEHATVSRWGTARLIVRGGRGPFTAFFGGTSELRTAFAQIARASEQPSA